MTKKTGIKVKVQRVHIEEGSTGDPNSCAIALAVKDALDHHYKSCLDPLNIINIDDISVSVDSSDVSVGDFSMPASNKISKFVDAFDKRDEKPSRDAFSTVEVFQNELKEWKKGQQVVKPFEFILKF